MGYDLHITRKKNWDGFEDEHGPEISLDEWIAMVRADAEMRLDGFCEVRLPHGKVFRLDRPSIAVWTAWSHHSKAGDTAWFDLRDGNVVVKNPDREIRRKMWRLAERLQAKVQGDDGEYYDRFGNPTDDEWKAQAFLSALVGHLGVTLVWDRTGGDIPPAPFARFPVFDSFVPGPSNAPSQGAVARVLRISIPRGGGTPEQMAALEAAREYAKARGVKLIITEE
ncbi:MAG: hypothetical protein ACLQFW_03125 [Xanthobacteraceae bacterium]